MPKNKEAGGLSAAAAKALQLYPNVCRIMSAKPMMIHLGKYALEHPECSPEELKEELKRFMAPQVALVQPKEMAAALTEILATSGINTIIRHFRDESVKERMMKAMMGS